MVSLVAACVPSAAVCSSHSLTGAELKGMPRLHAAGLDRPDGQYTWLHMSVVCSTTHQRGSVNPPRVPMHADVRIPMVWCFI